MAVYQCIIVEKEGAVDILTLNRPDRLNALSMQLVYELTSYFQGLREDFQTRAVILRGAGRGFCAGMDLNSQKAPVDKSLSPLSKNLMEQRQFADMILAIRTAPQPVIALVHGACCGAGFAMTLAADVRLVTPEAKMNVANYKIGLTGGDVGISYFLPRICGPTVAAEMMMTGRFVSGTRAAEVSLANELFETREAMEAGARMLAQEMLAADPNGLRMTKDCLQTAVDAPSYDSAVALEDRQQVLMALSGEWSQRVSNFNKKPSAKL